MHKDWNSEKQIRGVLLQLLNINYLSAEILIESMVFETNIVQIQTELNKKMQQSYYKGMSQNSEVLHWQN